MSRKWTAVCVVIAGCGVVPVTDGGVADGGLDAGFDAGTGDAGIDAGFDAGTGDAGPDAGPDAGFDAGPVWPADAQHVDALFVLSPLAAYPWCALGDGGLVSRSTWSIDLDSGVIDYAVCYAQEPLFVVDSGVLGPAQLDAFNAVANQLVPRTPVMPPCSNDSEIDRFVVTVPGGVVTLQDDSDHCVLPPDVVPVDNGPAVRALLEGFTHPW